MSELWGRIVVALFRVRWIVSLENGEMGVRIAGANFYYYKYSTPLIDGGEDGVMAWRRIQKREFGETVLSRYIHGDPPCVKCGHNVMISR